MGEIVYSKTNKFPDVLDSDIRDYKRCVAVKDTVFADENKVTLARSEQYLGRNEHSNKIWSRWATTSVVGLFRNRAGNLQPFTRVRNTRRGPDYNRFKSTTPSMALSMLDTPDECSDMRGAYRDAVNKYLGISELSDIYPMAKMYGIQHYLEMPYGIRHAFRNDNMRDFVSELFGKTNVRRDLIKASAQVSPKEICLMKDFRNLVPVDWIVNAMRNSEVQWQPCDGILTFDNGSIHIRSLLTQMNPKTYRRVLRNTLTERDLMLMINVTNRRHLINVDAERPFASYEDIHDAFFANSYYSRPFDDKDIPLTKVAKKFVGLRSGNLEIKPAQHTSIMTEWGGKMHNCIASYRTTALDGQGEYAGVYDGDRLIANIEVRGGRLIQLLGKYNRSLPADTRQRVVTMLESVGVNTAGDWWGKSDLT